MKGLALFGSAMLALIWVSAIPLLWWGFASAPPQITGFVGLLACIASVASFILLWGLLYDFYAMKEKQNGSIQSSGKVKTQD